MQPVAILAEMLGELAAMHREQAAVNQRQLEALHVQTERQSRALERLLVQPSPAPAPDRPTQLASLTLHKMSPEDDPQTFLEMFEATAEACSWPVTEWAVRVLPLLSGEAQTAALSLPAVTRGRYPDVRRAVLARMGRSPEDHRRRFRDLKLGPADRPFVYAQQLRDAASPGEARMVEQLVVE